MADKELEPEDIERKVHDLAKSMEKVRSRQADRDDVVVDIKHARLSRLEILAENLSPVFDALPDDNEQFEFAIAKGETPRLWIDMTSFVRMAGDGREFEFVKDTRMGRTILGRTSNAEEIGEQISEYVAERVLERERHLEGDWVAQRSARTSVGNEEESSDSSAVDDQAAQKRYGALKLFVWFLIGLVVGGGALFAILWFDQYDSIVNWFARINT